MKKKEKEGCFHEIILVLHKLNEEHPSFSLGRHISTAFSDYGDIWGLSDKEALFALKKYRAELQYNSIDESDDFLQKVIADAQNLDTILDEDDEDEDYN